MRKHFARCGCNVSVPKDSQGEKSELKGRVKSRKGKGRTRFFLEGEPEEECEPAKEEAKQPKPPLKKEGWKISKFKRAFPVKKYEAGFPDACKKVYMESRRPIWLPQEDEDSDYFAQASYFSEILARDQLQRQAFLEKMYKPNYGEYAYSKAELVGRTYISKYMKGVHCLKFSPTGKYLLIGTGNGTIQAQ